MEKGSSPVISPKINKKKLSDPGSCLFGPTSSNLKKQKRGVPR